MINGIFHEYPSFVLFFAIRGLNLMGMNNGRVIKFYATPGTLDNLFEIGVRDDANRTVNYYPNLPHVSTVDSWTQNNVLFKTEGGQLVEQGLLDDTQVNIGLGIGGGLGRFNAGLKAFEVVHIY